MAAVNQSPGNGKFTFFLVKSDTRIFKMFLTALLSILSFAASQSVVGVHGASQIFQKKVDSRGFINTNTTNSSANYYQLTQDGRLERIQLVFPEGTQVQQAIPETPSAPFLLTPDGRLEKLQEPEKVNEVIQYFKLSEDGRLQPIKEEDIPSDVQEENGEYHVLLPTGSLQKVRFMTTTKGNLKSAKVQYQEVEPLTGPVYRYASPLVRVV